MVPAVIGPIYLSVIYYVMPLIKANLSTLSYVMAINGRYITTVIRAYNHKDIICQLSIT